MKTLQTLVWFLAVSIGMSSFAQANVTLRPGESRFVQNDWVSCLASPTFPGDASVRVCGCYRNNSYVGQFLGEDAAEQCKARFAFGVVRDCTRLYGRTMSDVVCDCYRGNNFLGEVVANLSRAQELSAQCTRLNAFAGLDRCRVR